jgi:hypothetical protein
MLPGFLKEAAGSWDSRAAANDAIEGGADIVSRVRAAQEKLAQGRTPQPLNVGLPPTPGWPADPTRPWLDWQRPLYRSMAPGRRVTGLLGAVPAETEWAPGTPPR